VTRAKWTPTRTKLGAWLDRRFQETSSDGVYFAPSADLRLRRRALRAVSVAEVRTNAPGHARLGAVAVDSCLDVGAAEGYRAELVRPLTVGARRIGRRNPPRASTPGDRAPDILFVVLKDPAVWSDENNRNVTAREIVSFSVPFHHLG
jgi:hypothetical protein